MLLLAALSLSEIINIIVSLGLLTVAGKFFLTRLSVDILGERCRDDRVTIPDPRGSDSRVPALYLRVRVTNHGFIAAREVKVSVECIAFNGAEVDSEDSALNWTDRNTFDRQTIDGRTHAYADLCVLAKTAPDVMVIASQKGSKGTIYAPGLYRFDIVLRAQWSLPKRESFLVTHSGWTTEFLPSDARRSVSTPTVYTLQDPLRATDAPIVEPEALFNPVTGQGHVYVVNVGNEAAIDVTIGSVGNDYVRFGVIRTLRASDAKQEVPLFFNRDRAPAAALGTAMVVAMSLNKLGQTSRPGNPVMWHGELTPVTWHDYPAYVPICISYADRYENHFHNHDYVLADERTGDAPSEFLTIIRRRRESELAFDASPAHA